MGKRLLASDGFQLQEPSPGALPCIPLGAPPTWPAPFANPESVIALVIRTILTFRY